MLFIAIIPLLVCIIGLLAWRPTLKEAGQWCFITGLLVTLLVLAHYTVKLGT